MASSVFLALGSNLGDRKKNLETAIHRLPPHVFVSKTSSIYVTPPWGFLEQAEFLNQVVAATTKLAPGALLDYLKNIELEMGRVQTFKNGPRVIDLDILFYGDQVIQTKDLTIPHPHLHERGFVLVPLNEIAPYLSYPGSDRRVHEMLSALPEAALAGIRRFEEVAEP